MNAITSPKYCPEKTTLSEDPVKVPRSLYFSYNLHSLLLRTGDASCSRKMLAVCIMRRSGAPHASRRIAIRRRIEERKTLPALIMTTLRVSLSFAKSFIPFISACQSLCTYSAGACQSVQPAEFVYGSTLQKQDV
jgi:hypothetical protein